MRETYRKLFEILSARDRRVVALVFLVMLLSSAMEVVGIASILPFIAVLSNPEFVHQNDYLRGLFEFLGFEETQSFLVFLGLAFLTLFVFGLTMRTLSFWVQAKFANQKMYSLSTRLFFGYMCKDYAWFLDKHSTRLSTSVLSEVDRTINQGLFPALQLIAHMMVILLLVALLVFLDPLLAMSVVVVLGGAYSLIYVSVRKWVARIGERMLQANRGRFRTIQEGFGGLKDLKMKGLETSYLVRFRAHSAAVAKSRISEQLIGQLPSFAMQGVIFGGMLLVILYLMTIYDRFDQALPILGMYAVAGYRLMPSLQNVYRHLITLRHATAVVNTLHEDLNQIDEIEVAMQNFRDAEPLPLKREIRLCGVNFRYPGAEQDALKGLQIEIPRHSTVAFVGPTGCGKTTTVDIILGLLQPTAGTVEIDGVPLGPETGRGWQRNIGYVPQDIYMVDASVAANIAFGIPESSIDHCAVEKAAKIARLHDFVVEELDDGYDTVIGERGVRLSGGQKQRIGIARALYHDPEVLVLDEATSALDNLTEHAVMDAVHGLAKKKTIIMIAHRLTTVQSCDTIFLLDDGRVVAEGSYEELVASSQTFRKMTGTAATGS